MEKAIKIAIENGWKNGEIPLHKSPETILALGYRPDILIDISFWNALGKGQMWMKNTGICHCGHFQENHRKNGLGDDNKSSGIEENCFHCGCVMYISTKGTDWKQEMHHFIDHLASGKDIDSFFGELLK